MKTLIFYGLVIALIFGAGYGTAYKYWNDWYQAEKSRLETIDKEFEERGQSEVRRLEREDNQSKEILKENNEQSRKSPTANKPSLPRSSVQRLDRL